MDNETSRPEGAFVLLVMQATFWAAAGLSAFPFALAGEMFMVVLGLASLALAGTASLLAVGLVRRRRLARRWTLILEWACLVGSLLMLAVPIGANRGPVAILVDVVMPLALIVLLTGRRMRAHFGISSAPAR